MSYVFIAVFIVFSAVHLYASYKKNKKLRAMTKGFILSSLLGWYCFSAQNVLILFALALFFSWLGDVLLIPHGVRWFTVGGIAFLISHVLFVLTYSRNVSFGSFSPIIAVLIALVYAAAVLFVFKGLKPHLPKLLFLPMALYLVINGTMNCFAFYQLLSVPCTATVITFIGAVLFFCSDSILFYTRFKTDTVFKSHFPVMLTYIIAEFLITLGTLIL